MKKHLFLTALVLALVMCFSFGVCAHELYPMPEEPADPNSYKIDGRIVDGYAAGDVWIGTNEAWGGETYGINNTFFDNGEAIHPNDIIITNGNVGVVLSVGTRNPWGYPSGSVLDSGVVSADGADYYKNYVGGRDNTWSIEPLINGWDSWAPNNCGTVKFAITEYDFGTGLVAAVKVTRIYRIGDRAFDVVTYYGAEDDSDYIYMYNEITNVSEEASSTSVRFCVTNKGDDSGAMFSNKVNAAIGSYTITEDFQYCVGLMMPGHITTSTGSEVMVGKWGGSVGYKELRIDGVADEGDSAGDGKYKFAAGESVTFPCAIVISDKADFEKINAYYLNTLKVPAGTENPFTDVEAGVYYEKPVLWAVAEGVTVGKTATEFAPADACTRAQAVTFLYRAAGEPAVGEVENPFTDVKEGAYYENAVLWAVENGITSGMTKTTFAPESTVTRGQMVTFMHRAAGLPDVDEETENVFEDVKAGAYYEDAVLWAIENDITKGVSNTEFAPADPCTRAQIVTFLYRADNDVTTVTGKTVAEGTVIVQQNGKDYGWFIADEDGAFSFDVPCNDGNKYEMFLEANGYVDSDAVVIKNVYDTFAAGELKSGAAKVPMTIKVTDKDGNAIPAKIEVFEKDGEEYVSAYPTVRFNGESVYYTNKDLDPIAFEVEPGAYKVVVYGYGYWFYSDAVPYEGNTADGKKALEQKVEIKLAAADGWYSGDVHHHTNKNDAFSAPIDVIASQAASGLDIGVTTDHDFTTNNFESKGYVEGYANMEGYYPSEEISCSWAHFNVIPLNADAYEYFLDEEKHNHVMNQFAELPYFVEQTHRVGGTVDENNKLIENGTAITANHPWYSYGLFYAYSQGAIPGGYTDAYDNIELNACSEDYELSTTILSTVDLWTSYVNGTSIYDDVNGVDVKTLKPHYLVASSDTHDVRYPGFAGEDYTNTRAAGEYASGKGRTFAFVEDMADKDTEAAGLAYGNAVLAGHSYVSFGPLMSFETIPGTEVKAAADGKATIKFGVASLEDIDKVYVLTETGAEPLVSKSITEVNYVTDFSAKKDLGYADKQTVKYDKVATDALVKGTKDAAGYTPYTVTVPAKASGKTWAAILVMDANGNYAISNPWWIVK